MPTPVRNRFPGTARLKGNAAFNRVFTEGMGFRRGQIVVKYLLRSDTIAAESRLRVGFVVKRAAGTAVKRNRLRRRVREAYRLRKGEFEGMLPEGIALDVVFLWAGTAQQALRPDFQAIRSDIESAQRKLARLTGTHQTPGNDATA